MSNSQKLQFENYNLITVTNILSSHFVYRNTKQIPQLKTIKLSIRTKNLKKIHFWYLYLLNMQKPYIKKFYFSWKTRAQKSNLIRPKIKSIRWQVNIKKKNLYFLNTILFDLFFAAHPLEKRILKIQENMIGIAVPSAPLSFQTFKLRSHHSNYSSTIPLTLWFIWTNTTFFQKIFILRHWKILNQPNIKYLDQDLYENLDENLDEEWNT